MSGWTEIALDEVVHFDVTTHVFSTGAVSDADSAPTFDVYEESTDTGLLGAQTMTKRTSLTGNYRGTFTASAANGFEVGKWYNVIVLATVSTVAAKLKEVTFRLTPAEALAGHPKVDVGGWLGTAPATPNVAGVPSVDLTHIEGSTGDADNFTRWVAGMIIGSADSGTTTTMVDAGLTAADTDYYKGHLIVFTSGNIADQARLITGFDPATDTVTFAPATTQAVSTQSYVIIPWGRVDVGMALGTTVQAASGRFEVDAELVGGATPETAADIALAVRNVDMTGAPLGSLGAAIGDPGADADTIWALVNTNLDAPVSAVPDATEVKDACKVAIDDKLTSIAVAVWTYIIKGTHTAENIMRALRAWLYGSVTGAATATPVYNDPEAGTPVITGVSVDSSGNRSASTTNLT